jgi:hypothetical protein
VQNAVRQIDSALAAYEANHNSPARPRANTGGLGTMKHSLERTSPKGQAFIGTCVLCGAPNLALSAAQEDCSNVRGLTDEQALIEAIEGPLGGVGL